MSIPHWFQNADDWDTITLGEFRMPGVWTIEGPVKRAIDVKKKKGFDGGRLKDEGYEPGAFDLVGRMVEPDHWKRLQEIIPTIHPLKSGGVREPVFIDHPATALLGIEYVYIDEIYTPSLDNGILEIRMHAYQWTSASAPKKKSKGKPQTPGGVDPLAEPPVATNKLSNVPGITPAQASFWD